MVGYHHGLSGQSMVLQVAVEMVRYATSGDITGDRSEVVGYAGIVVQ